MGDKKNNFFLDHVTRTLKYSGRGGGRSEYPVISDPEKHAEKLLHQYSDVIRTQKKNRNELNGTVNGYYVEFSGKDGYPLKVESLENVRDGVRLLSVKEQNDCMKASVFIPEHKENFFTSRINDYADINLIKKRNISKIVNL